MYSFLIVDDEPVIRKGISTILKHASSNFYPILEANNGKTALKLMQTSIPDIIITDIRMPQMDGLCFCSTVRKTFKDIPIIIISGYNDFDYAKRAIEYNVKDYILKPVSRDKLTETVGNITEFIKKQREIFSILLNDYQDMFSLLIDSLLNGDKIRVSSVVEDIKKMFNALSISNCTIAAQELVKNVINRFSEKTGYFLDIYIDGKSFHSNKQVFDWLDKIFDLIMKEIAANCKCIYHSQIYTAKKYIKENYSNDVSLEEISNLTGYNPSYFSQIFRKCTGKTFVKYKIETKIEKAKEMLNQPDKSITQVSYSVGFNNVNSFTRCFKQITGMTPKEFKKKGSFNNELI